MTRYRIRTLGPNAVLDARGESVSLPAGKLFAALLYTAMVDRPPTREDLAALLWPASPRARAFQSLRQTLLQLRHTLGDDVLVENAVLRVNPAAISVDAIEFRQCVERGDLESASTLWEGAFCDRCVIAGAPEWQHWADQIRRDLSAQYARLLRERARAEQRQSHLTSALALLRRAVDVEPFEPSHRSALIELLIDAGDVGEAAGALIEARRVFADAEYRVELDALEHKLQSATSQRAGQREQSLLRPEFVGRAAELALIRDVWRRAEQGQVGIITIAGAAGVGKTRLAEESCLLAAAAGARVISVKSAEPERRIEWGTVSLLVRELRRLRGAGGVSGASDRLLRALLPSQDATAAGDSTTIQPAPLADALSDLIGAVTYEAPLIVLLDDFQWADEASRSLLMRVMRAAREERALFLITLRKDDLPRDVQRGLDALERSHATRALRIAPLDRADVAELLSGFINLERAAAAREAIDRIYAATDGNPLFIVELLQVFAEDGTLEPGETGWSLHVDRLPAQIALPASLRALIDRRLDRLSSPALQLLAALARQKRYSLPHEVRGAARLTEDEFTRVVYELVDREIIHWDGDTLVFTHDAIREAVYSRTRFAQTHEWSRRRVVAAAIIVTALLVTGAWGVQRYLNVPPRYGGGQLLIGLRDSVIAVEPVGRGSRWNVVRPRHWVPDVPMPLGPFLRPDGGWRWFYHAAPRDSSPYPVEAFPDGSVRVIAKRYREDTGFGGLSPDGAWLTYTQDNPATPEYDIALFRARVDGSDRQLLYQAASSLRVGSWSPDRSAIAVAIADRTDTILVLRPTGERIATFTFPDVAGLNWCGPNRILASVSRGEDHEFALIRLDSSTVRRIPLGPHSHFACSPDGTAFVYNGLSGGQWAFLWHDIATGRTDSLPIHANPQATYMSWVQDRLEPFATGVAITDVPDSLRAGERLKLQADVRFSDGKTRPEPIRWESKNASIASVDSTGLVTGNRTGTTEVVARAVGWRSDSVRIHVSSALPGAIALEDRFERLDTMRWHVVGETTPRIRKIGNESWLQLTGDGNHVDGLTSKVAFDLTAGATLELEFRIKLTRTDRQFLLVGLNPGDLVPGGNTRNNSDWDLRPGVDFRYPGRELLKFDPMVASYSASNLPSFARVETLLILNDWNHLAIQLRADGHASAYLNRKFLVESPLPVRVQPGERWRVVIQGAAVDTELLVRNIVLWRELRFH
jgi:DNA-binding SARP family transcriptional activator